MRTLKHLFDRNRAWAENIEKENPEFFHELAAEQHPEYLWIGCSDSRVPANQIVDLPPGEVFVHRNIANVVAHTDVNVLSVVHFAVEVLKVKHIIVCGHYGCGGIHAAMQAIDHGFIEHWLCHVKDVMRLHAGSLQDLDEESRFDLLCELNVREQVSNVSKISVVQEAWKRGQDLHIHGWIFNVVNGRLKDLHVADGT